MEGGHKEAPQRDGGGVGGTAGGILPLPPQRKPFPPEGNVRAPEGVRGATGAVVADVNVPMGIVCLGICVGFSCW